MIVQIKPIVGDGVGLDHTLIHAGRLVEGRLGANGNRSGPTIWRMIGKAGVNGRRVKLLRNTIGRRFRMVALRSLRSQINEPTRIHAVNRQITGNIVTQIRRRESNGASTLLAVHHNAFHGVRMPQNRIGVLDASPAKQVTHIRGTPHTHELGLVLLAPCAAFRLGSAFQRVCRLAMAGRRNRLGIGWHAGLSGTSIINHFKLEHTSSEREILNGFHVSGAIRTHGRVGTEHQGAHTQLADHLTEEESV